MSNMIQRISKSNDLKDVLLEYRPEIVEHIFKIEYYVGDVCQEFDIDREGTVVSIRLDAEKLKNFPDGILYRKVYYNTIDERYPDQRYDLVSVDCMDIWLED